MDGSMGSGCRTRPAFVRLQGGERGVEGVECSGSSTQRLKREDLPEAHSKGLLQVVEVEFLSREATETGRVTRETWIGAW